MHPHPWTQVLRGRRAPRRPHLASLQARGNGPQRSVIGIASHLASRRRRPRDSQPPLRSRSPTHALGGPAPRPRAAAARPFPARTRAQTAPPARPRGPRPAPPRPALPGPRAPQLPAPRRRRRPRSPPGWGAPPARSAAAAPEAARRPPAPGLRRPDGPCLAARASAAWTLLGHVTRPPGCQPEDTPRRGQSAGGAPGRAGRDTGHEEARGGAAREGRGAPDSQAPCLGSRVLILLAPRAPAPAGAQPRAGD